MSAHGVQAQGSFRPCSWFCPPLVPPGYSKNFKGERLLLAPAPVLLCSLLYQGRLITSCWGSDLGGSLPHLSDDYQVHLTLCKWTFVDQEKEEQEY